MTWTTSPPREPGFYWVRWTNEDGTPQRYAFVEEGPFGPMPHGTEFGQSIPSAEALAAMEEFRLRVECVRDQVRSRYFPATLEYVNEALTAALDAARKETE